MDPVGGRRVLDQLDQAVAEHDWPGDTATLRPTAGSCGRAAVPARACPKSSAQLRAPRTKFMPPCRAPAPDLRIGPDEIRRRDHVEDLPGGEFDHLLVLSRHAAHAGCRVAPPLLLQQEGGG